MLSLPIEQMQDEYDVVVIGSGYGGGVSASRLSRAGYSVCLLERGREFQAGDFPDTMPEMLREAQTQSELGHVGSKTGLFDVRLFEETSIVCGCGLGGTSLINANVAVRLDPRVWQDQDAWPQDLLDDLDLLETCYQQAEAMLKPATLPDEFDHLLKYQAHKNSYEHLKENPEFAHAEFYKTPINVNFENKINHVGVEQQACNHCGDCVSGCNHTAKNTTAMNYIPDAVNHGAEVFCEAAVHYIEKADDHWLVHFNTPHWGREAFDVPTQFIRTKKVIVAAGTLGSNEIMLRSKAKGLPLSDQLGQGYSGNGDVLAFGYNMEQEINGIGSGEKDPEKTGLVGPCITSVIDCRKADDVDEGFVLEEGSIPGGLAPILPGAYASAAGLLGRDTDFGIRDKLKEQYQKTLSFLNGPYKGAVDRTQTYLVMTHDNAAGKLKLKDDRVELSWPDVAEHPNLKRVARAMTEATEALGGTFVKNPITNKLMKNNQISVHPLGGCCMGENADTGVINHKGQVFNNNGNEVHQGLYISDGSVLPRSVGINPLLTISAITERMCHYIVEEEKNQSIPLNFDHQETPLAASETPLGIRFTEKMAGYFLKGKQDYQVSHDQGKALGDEGEFEFVLTIISRDVDAMLSHADHKASLFGTVNAPALSSQPLAATNGTFQLFVADAEDEDTLYMRYQMDLLAEEGKRYQFEGHKVIHDDPGFDIWEDTTTLFITITDDDNTLVGKGILKIDPRDFMKQMTTVKAINGRNFLERMKTVAKFSQFFTKKLYGIYL